MAKNKHLFTEEEEKHIINAITKAEKETSGEIRIHIEHKCPKEALERAIEVFHNLEMHNTKHRNGVLVYVATEDQKLGIYGDKSIHDHVGQHFWDDVLELMQNYFKAGNYEAGLTEAITRIGYKLKDRFPYQEGDTNELKNEISYDDPED
ncbi:MAG TPA: TPM domain-containing protein [Balneolales bacterium]|nr:TPM domain-containing protein [Balneolales bacterium]